MNKERVAICIPCIDKPEMLFLKSMSACHYVLGAEGIETAMLTSSASMGAFQARNQILQGVEELEKQGNNIDWLFWLDADMVFPPHTYLQLRHHNKDIVGATYVRRTHPFDVHGRGLTGKPQEVNSGLLEMAALPTGVLLTRRDIFRHMQKPYFRCIPDEKTGLTHGEDYHFCWNARQLGYKIWLDVDLSKEIGHIGQKVYTIEKDGYSGVPEVLEKESAA